MTTALEAALAEMAKLPPEEQDALATLLMDEIKSEQRWSKAFAVSQKMLQALATDALAEHRAGKTKPLDESLGGPSLLSNFGSAKRLPQRGSRLRS